MKTQFPANQDKRNADTLGEQCQPIDQLIKNSFDSANLFLFEVQLAKSGLLLQLEASGAVPKTRNSNPYDAVREQRQHNEWWEKHPEQYTDYRKRVSEREKALRQVYLGMHLR